MLSSRYIRRHHIYLCILLLLFLPPANTWSHTWTEFLPVLVIFYFPTILPHSSVLCFIIRFLQEGLSHLNTQQYDLGNVRGLHKQREKDLEKEIPLIYLSHTRVSFSLQGNLGTRPGRLADISGTALSQEKMYIGTIRKQKPPQGLSRNSGYQNQHFLIFLVNNRALRVKIYPPYGPILSCLGQGVEKRSPAFMAKEVPPVFGTSSRSQKMPHSSALPLSECHHIRALITVPPFSSSKMN